jgi:hypothetical protein
MLKCPLQKSNQKERYAIAHALPPCRFANRKAWPEGIRPPAPPRPSGTRRMKGEESDTHSLRKTLLSSGSIRCQKQPATTGNMQYTTTFLEIQAFCRMW